MVKIRLKRMGARKRPFYRVVVADARSPRDGRFIENIGKYHPLAHPSVIEIDEERALHWLQSGAQPTDPVRVLLEKTGVWARFTGQEPPPPLAEGPPEEAAEGEAPAAPAEAPSEEPTPEDEPAAPASAASEIAQETVEEQPTPEEAAAAEAPGDTAEPDRG